MPNNIVKSFAEKSGKSVKEVERLWDKAKELVKDEYPDTTEGSEEFYQLVIGILKKMCSIKSEEFDYFDVNNFSDLIEIIENIK